MATKLHEKPALILLDTLKAALPGKGKGTLAANMAALRYEVDGKPPIVVTFVSGTIVAQTHGLPAIKGGFMFNEPADEAGARTLGARIVAWVNAH